MYYITHFNFKSDSVLKITSEPMLKKMYDEYLLGIRKAEKERRMGNFEFYQLVQSFERYKDLIKRMENGDWSKLGPLLMFKKLFSIPWILCYEYLLP